MKLIDNISIYFSLMKASIKGMMEYRTDFIVGIVSQLLTQSIELIFIWIIFQNTKSLAGWNMNQMILLYGITMIVASIVDLLFDELYDIGPKYMKDGEFDKVLLRPIHPLITIIGSSRSTTSFGYMGIGLILVITMLIKLQIPITFLLIIKILFFSIVGAAIIGAIMVVFSISSFLTHHSNEFIWTAYRTYTFTQYPIEIYNKFIRIFITCIFPFAFATYYQAESILNIGNTKLIYLSPIIAIVLWIIAVKLWNLALNKYRSTGN